MRHAHPKFTHLRRTTTSQAQLNTHTPTITHIKFQQPAGLSSLITWPATQPRSISTPTLHANHQLVRCQRPPPRSNQDVVTMNPRLRVLQRLAHRSLWYQWYHEATNVFGTQTTDMNPHSTIFSTTNGTNHATKFTTCHASIKTTDTTAISATYIQNFQVPTQQPTSQPSSQPKFQAHSHQTHNNASTVSAQSTTNRTTNMDAHINILPALRR